jgi:gliding motility-associated-like protein
VRLPNTTIIENNSFNLKNDASIFGRYSAVTSLENCVSDTSFLTIQPDAPISNINIDVPSQFCDLDTILIKTVNGFEQYRFFVNGQVFTQNNKPEFRFIPTKVDSLVVFVETYDKNCLVGKSNPQLIKTGVKPTKPTIQPGVFDICLADSLRLNIQNPILDQEYIWYLPTGKTLISNSLRIIDLPNNLQGSYQVVAKKGTCLSLPSDAVDVKVKPRIPIPSFQSSLPNICEDGTTSVNLCLSNIPKDNTIQFVIEQLPSKKIWSQGRDSCINKLSSTFEPNTNRLRLYATKEGCTSDEFTDLNINYTVQPNIKASIVPPTFSICNNVDTIRLFNATPIDTLQVIWRVFSSAKLKTLPKNEISLSNISKGVNKIILTISYLGCRNFSSDTINLLSGLEPSVLDTTLNVLDDLPILLPFDYDSISRFYTVSFKNLEGGKVTEEDGQFKFYPKRFFEGPDTIRYTICFGKCSDQCKEGLIPLVFNKDIACIAPNVITPNGDGINDVFILPCLESDQWGGAQLLVVDQWGNEVFKSSNYQNDFDGTKNGNNLPYDTYYYVIKPNKGVEPLSGFLIIRQE